MQYKIAIIFATFLIELQSQNLISNVGSDLLNSLSNSSYKVYNFSELAAMYGLPCEEHTIVTEDNYILTVFRLPGNEAKVDLLMHGNLDSADAYILRGNTSLAYLLHKEGHDVWVGNFRGNKYSSKHVTWNPDTNRRYWNFSFDQIGAYDMPATIDYILDKTGQKKLRYIGHSEGTTVMLVYGSIKPENNDKIAVFVALAPICHLQYMKPPLVYLAKLAPALNAALLVLNQDSVFTNSSNTRALFTLICSYDLTNAVACTQIYRFFGYEPGKMDPEFYQNFANSFPAGTSRTNIDHLSQMNTNKLFSKYDYRNSLINIAVYGVPSPPAYNISRVVMDMVFYRGKADRLSVKEDVERLITEVGSTVEYNVLARETFDHGDFTTGETAYIELYPQVIEVLDRY